MDAAAALRSSRRRLIAALAFGAAIVVVGRAATASVEYDFAGGNFMSVTGPYTTSDQVTGDVIFPTASPLFVDLLGAGQWHFVCVHGWGQYHH